MVFVALIIIKSRRPSIDQPVFVPAFLYKFSAKGHLCLGLSSVDYPFGFGVAFLLLFLICMSLSSSCS